MNLDRVNMDHHGLDFVAGEYCFCKCGWYYGYGGVVAEIPAVIQLWFDHLEVIQRKYEERSRPRCDGTCPIVSANLPGITASYSLQHKDGCPDKGRA